MDEIFNHTIDNHPRCTDANIILNAISQINVMCRFDWSPMKIITFAKWLYLCILST
ncbi:MAG: hypothetical protein ACI9P5_003311 [Saprospiraceae bacterium]|jgi:hypothetical protein